MGPPEEFPFHLLLHAAHLVDERLRARLATHGIQARQARVLDALGRLGEASQTRLASEFGVTAASMSTMTSRLVKAGLIGKRTDPEELRRNILCLTARGRELLGVIYDEWEAVNQDIRAAIGAEDAAALAILTGKLRDALGGSTPAGEAPRPRPRAGATDQQKEIP